MTDLLAGPALIYISVSLFICGIAIMLIMQELTRALINKRVNEWLENQPHMFRHLNDACRLLGDPPSREREEATKEVLASSRGLLWAARVIRRLCYAAMGIGFTGMVLHVIQKHMSG